MLINYIKIAWRSMINNKFYTAINLTGLTTGLTVGILVLLWVQDELSYDKFNANADHIYRVNAQLVIGNTTQIWNGVQGPVATYALKEVPGVINTARMIYNTDYSIFKYGDRSLGQSRYGNYYVDPSLFKMFDIQLLRGDVNKPFTNDRSILITETTAKKFFGNDDPVGKTIRADKMNDFVVGGVVKDMPENSSIKFDMLFTIELRKKQYDGKGRWASMDSDWGDYYADTYVMLKPGTSIKKVEGQLTNIHVKNHIGVTLSNGHYLLQPLVKMHLYTADGADAGIKTVRIFFAVAILILLIACINYINLSTTRAMLRSKEVSIRKIIGAGKFQLFVQFIIGTTLFFAISLVLAFIVITGLIPFYNQLAGKNLHFNLLDPAIWRLVSIIVLGTLIASGIYPALLLSSFKPVSALKGKLGIGIGNTAFRKILVICQFTCSVVLIISTIIINRQLQFVRNRDLGYDNTYIFSFHLRDMYRNYDGIRAELLRSPSIKNVTSASENITEIGGGTGDTDWDGKPLNAQFLITSIDIDNKYVDFFKLKLVSGHDFRGEKVDSAHYILNETAVKEAGIKDPVGKRFKLYNTNGTIIGVVKDFHFASLKNKIAPAILVYHKTSDLLFIKTTGKDVPKAVAAVEQQWKKYNPGFPFEYSFLDEQYNALYKADVRSGDLFGIFTVVAILISCLGLFGLAAYTAQNKAKEIGIRKVLGAGVIHITTMLSKDFLTLVIVAIVIAAPFAWYVMNIWLQGFAYRIEIQWWMFVLSGLSAILIAFATVSGQAIKAAVANPVKSLRSE
jgi:putative ABC transport system permease protein